MAPSRGICAQGSARPEEPPSSLRDLRLIARVDVRGGVNTELVERGYPLLLAGPDNVLHVALVENVHAHLNLALLIVLTGSLVSSGM